MSDLHRYPIFVPSKDRATTGHTVKFLIRDRTPFRLVVEPAQEATYRAAFPEANIIVTPRDDMRLLGTRNFIRQVATDEGWKRHWQLDDNMRGTRRLYRGKRIVCDSGTALRACEDLTDRYENVGVSGLNYQMFVTDKERAPFYLNSHVYSCSLINNEMPWTWRLVYNDDTDLCLQVLAGGWCTINLNVFMIDKIRTMVVKGGNTNQLYEGDGRLRMANMLAEHWPGVVTVERRFQRPQHVVNWRKFDNPLIRRTDIDWEAIESGGPVEYGSRLVALNEVRSPDLRALLDD